MFYDFLSGIVGTVPSELDFIIVLGSVALAIIVSALVIGLFVGAISGLTIKFFK